MAVLIAALILVLAFLAYLAAGIWSYGRRNEVVHADAILVLGITCTGEEPSPAFKERINHGISLYKQGRAPKMIFSGGRRLSRHPVQAELAREYALSQGVSPRDILTETRSRMTEQNMRFTRDLAEKEGLKSFIVVSDPLHMKRAMLMARDLGLDAHPSPTPTTYFSTAGRKLAFLAYEVLFLTAYLITRPFTRR